jgi:hypothetical protein
MKEADMDQGRLTRIKGGLTWMTLSRRGIAVIYLVILVVGLGAIELRLRANNPHAGLVGRAPLLVAAYNWIFRPERMQYVAAADLKANHKIDPSDLTQLDKSFCDYLPSLKDITGKYLKREVTAGKPVLLQNLSEAPTVEPRSDSWIVSLRLALDPRAEKILQPESSVDVLLSSTEKVNGKILSRSLDTGPTRNPASSDSNKPETKTGQQPSASPKGESPPKD